MATLAALCCSLALGWLFCQVKAYPIGDLTLDGLLDGFNVMTATRRRRQAESNGCSYPGLVAITAGNTVVYSGIYQEGTVRLPSDAITLLTMSNSFIPLVIYGGDGKAKSTINIGGVAAETVKNTDGTSSITLSEPLTSGGCPSNEAILYQSATMEVDVNTCTMVSFLGDQIKSHTYDGTLRLDPLAKNNVMGCCAHVLPNIVKRKNPLANPAESDVASSFTCAKSTKGICTGGIGAPIYCRDTRNNQEVVVGMADSGTCREGEYFGVIDFTTGNLAGFSS